MNISKLITNIKDGYYNKDFSVLYSNETLAQERFLKACEDYTKYFNNTDDMSIFSAPGRTEVGGNHTDHEHGLVLTGSVNLDVIAIVGKNNDNVVRIKSEGYNMDEIDLSDLDKKDIEEGKAISLIRGVLAFFKQSGYKIGGFNAYTTSNVLKGSGLSSSAAFEVLICNILKGLFNNDISAKDIAKISQKAENIYFNKPCGLLDQMASSIGGFTFIDFNDPKNPIIEKIDFNLSNFNHSLCIINTGGDHADLTDEYAAITTECKEVSRFFNKEFLRDVSEEEFYSKIKEIRVKLGDRAVLRAIHIFEENKRVILQKQALLSSNFDEFLKLINASGNSSYKYLQNVYASKNPSSQGISLCLALCEKILNKKGACRVHGGGFAGTVQCFVPNEMLVEFKNKIESVFGDGSCYILNIRPIGGHIFN